MPLGMRQGGVWGLPLLTGCVWWMAWQDYRANLGLQWGCRPVPALSCTLLPQVTHSLIWWAASGKRPLHRNQAGRLAQFLTGGGSLLPEVRYQDRAQQAEDKRQPRHREFSGSWKLELEVKSLWASRISGEMRGRGGHASWRWEESSDL